MKRNLPIILLSVVCAFQLAAASTVSAADAPPFLQVGKQYTLVVPVGDDLMHNQFKVLELGDAGWVRVVMTQKNQVMWLNTNQALLIAPFPPQNPE